MWQCSNGDTLNASVKLTVLWRIYNCGDDYYVQCFNYFNSINVKLCAFASDAGAYISAGRYGFSKDQQCIHMYIYVPRA